MKLHLSNGWKKKHRHFNTVLRTFESRRDEAMRESRKIHNYELYIFSPNFISMIKLKGMRR
jgi:hypothetical protein